MFGKSARDDVTAELWERLDNLEALVRDIHVSLIVRDIPTSRAMEAYDGLRKQVALAARARREHQAQLVQLQEVLQSGASAEDVGRLSSEWCLQAGIREIWDFGDGSLFTVEGDSTLNGVQVHRPAWLDDDSGSLIRQGIAIRVHVEVPEPAFDVQTDMGHAQDDAQTDVKPAQHAAEAEVDEVRQGSDAGPADAPSLPDDAVAVSGEDAQISAEQEEGR